MDEIDQYRVRRYAGPEVRPEYVWDWKNLKREVFGVRVSIVGKFDVYRYK